MRRTSQLGFLVAVALGVLVVAGPLARGQSAEGRELVRMVTEAQQLHDEGKLLDAAELFGRAAALSRRVPKAGELTSVLMFQQGMSYLEGGQAAKARPVLEQALATNEAVFGKNHPRTARAAYGLAGAHAELRDFDKAETLFLRSRRLYEAAGPAHTGELAEVLVHLAELYHTTERPREAEPLFRRGIELMETRGARNDANLMVALGKLGKLYRESGEYPKAEETFRRSLAIAETRAAREPRYLGDVLRELAWVYMDLGQHDKAEALSSRGLKLLEDTLGKDHLELQYHLQLLGALARRKGEDDKALAFYERWRKIVETHLGPKDLSLYYVLGSEAVLHGKQGRYDQALALELRGLKLLEASVGPDAPEVALALVNLSESYWHLGERAKAEESLERALHIRERRLGLNHPEVGHTLDWLAAVYGDAGKWDKAMPAFDRGRRLHRAYVGRILTGLSEAQQASFLESLDGATFGSFSALSVALVRKDDPATVARTAEWLLNEKAVVQQALAERGLLARDGSDPALAPAVRELTATRRRLATLALAVPKAGSEEEHRQQVRRLEEREQELAQRAGRAGGHRTATDPWVGLEEVRKALPADGVLVEIVRFPVRDYDYANRNKPGKTSAVRFVAWVIPPAGQGNIRVLDLGEAEAIDKAVQAARAALQGAAAAVRDKGEPEAEKDLRQPLKELAERILHPLLAAIGRSKQWVVSPDDVLWLVPWAALPLPDGKYAVEEHTIRYVVSGRDLATPPAQGTPGRPRIVADPDYDLAPADAVAQTNELVGERNPTELRGLLPAARLPKRVPRLPGTALEAAAIKANLEKYAGQKPWVYLQEQALEGVVKAFPSPKVLVLSTHGYFLPGEEKKAEEKRALEDRPPARPLENPLLRCGLLLAGCNQRDKATGPRDEDGVLTGLEILEMDLRGTELVVLSACETGLGDVRGGEGVAGLRQAFQLAGARTVVATLWQIPDRETARLMNDFFAYLADGQDKAEALRAAQLKLIGSRRQRDGAAHPLFWAAFTLTGQGK